VSALTTLTLAAGLASTVFAPLTAVLADHLDWRATYIVLAGILALVTVPGHALGLRRRWPPAQHHADPDDPAAAAPGQVARSSGFLTLAAAMSLASFSIYAVIVNLVPLLTGRGLPTSTAALALGLGGLGQVLGRLGYTRLTAATSVRARTGIILLAGAAATAALGLTPGPAPLLVALAVAAGATRGVFTLLQATAITDRWGPSHYGHLSGLLAAPTTLAAAVAPWAGAALAGALGGYPPVFAVLAVTTAAAAVLATTRTATPDR
jgi:predicted MFS family arabinose efflux permease